MANDQNRYEQALKTGHSYSWDQRWPEAVTAFEQAIEAGRDKPAPYAGLGMAYLEMGRLEEALENYKLAARYSNGDMIYLRHVADVQERLGQLHEAGRTYMAMGEIQLRRRKLDEAVGNWLRAVRLDPALIGAHQRLASVYQRQGLTSGAVREYLAIARIYYSLNDPQKALQVCRAALALDPRNPDVLTAIELIEHGDELPEEPEQETTATDESAAIAQRLADAFETGRDRRDGELQRGPDSPTEEAQRLAEQQLASQILEADDEGSSAAEQQAKLERDALISQALDFQRRRRFEEAIDCFERALAADGESPALRYSLGLLYQKKMRHGAAIGALEHVSGQPDYRLAAHFALGNSHFSAGSMQVAARHYLTAVRLVDLELVSQEQRAAMDQQYKQLAKELLEEGQPEQAADFAAAVRDFMTQPDWRAHVERARQRLDALARDGRSLILGEIMLAGSARVVEALHLSQELAQKGKHRSALEEAYHAIQLSPSYLPAHLRVAEILADQNQLEAATLKLVTIADTYVVRGDKGSALDTYERAVTLAPLDLKTRSRLIALLKEGGQYERALRHYQALADAYYNLAQLDEARSAYVEALRLTNHIENNDRWRADLLQRIADIDMQHLDWKRALSAYTELSTLRPGDEDTALTLIDLLFKAGYRQRALKSLDRYLTHLARSGKAKRIATLLQQLIQARPAEAGLSARLARLLIHQKRLPEAVAVLDRLGEAQLDAGEPKQAIVTIERILSLNPPDADEYRTVLARLREHAA
ncbi:MAG: tetratricopeptide repeat protein [Candidatus Promineifilaceae bacterium]|nr:tetratricopeptide repeat protein [Candidatus Promineifilaceae bacterium]